MSDLVVEVWEHESWAVGRGWAVAQNFRTREGVAAASTLETYASPRGYLWSGDWSLGVVYGRNGYELPQGWEYALKVDHFGARALAPGPASDLGAPPRPPPRRRRPRAARAAGLRLGAAAAMDSDGQAPGAPRVRAVTERGPVARVLARPRCAPRPRSREATGGPLS